MTLLAIDIRKAEPRDAESIARVHNEAWRNAYAGIIPHRALSTMINRRGAKWWGDAIGRGASVSVVDVGGTVAGYATFGRNRARQLPQEGEVYELYLAPHCQGIGLGGRLFKAARERLKRERLAGTVVWALEENGAALDFYSHAGGRDIAEGVEIFDGVALRKIAFVWE